MTAFPEIGFVRRVSGSFSKSRWLSRHAIAYEKCRLDMEFDDFVYKSCIYAGAVFIAVAIAGTAYVLLSGIDSGEYQVRSTIYVLAAALAVSAAVFFGMLWSVSSLKDYRGAVIDSKIVHAVALMLAMASFNVPARRIFRNLSNLGPVYGEDLALEAAYILSLIEEDGLDVISALRKAQSTSPSLLWQELLIGIAAVYGSGGGLKEYLEVRYRTLCEHKVMDARQYNDTVQGMASVYLSVIGIASIFVAILNLVFNMTGMVSGSAFVWIDAVVVVPLGSFVLARVLKTVSPEA